MNNPALRRPTLALLAITIALTGIFTLAMQRPSEGQTRVVGDRCTFGVVGESSGLVNQTAEVSLFALNISPDAVRVRFVVKDWVNDTLSVSPIFTIPPGERRFFRTTRSSIHHLSGAVQIMDADDDFSQLVTTMDYKINAQNDGQPWVGSVLEHCVVIPAATPA